MQETEIKQRKITAPFRTTVKKDSARANKISARRIGALREIKQQDNCKLLATISKKKKPQKQGKENLVEVLNHDLEGAYSPAKKPAAKAVWL